LIAATPPPVQQKKLFASTAFFASLGVLSKPHNSIAVRLCSFFRKIAKQNPIKIQHLTNGNLLKKSSEPLNQSADKRQTPKNSDYLPYKTDRYK
jgi:hypothetical protein